MSGGSDFEMEKLNIFNQLDALKRLTENQDAIDDIYRIQKMVQALQELRPQATVIPIVRTDGWNKKR